MRCLPAESKADALWQCRDKKAAAAGEKAGLKQADKGGAKQAEQQGIPNKADAKLSFGRIEVGKGKATCLEPVAMVLGSPSPVLQRAHCYSLLGRHGLDRAYLSLACRA